MQKKYYSVHKLGLVPIELGASDWKDSPHFFEHATLKIFMHIFYFNLVSSFQTIDLCTNALSVTWLQLLGFKYFFKRKLNVSLLKVVIVNTNWARKSLFLRVNDPFWLPFATPEILHVQGDATQVNLQVTFSVEAQSWASGAFAICLIYIGINCFLYLNFVALPLFVKLFWEVTFSAKNLSLESARIKRKFDTKFLVKIDKIGFIAIFELDTIVAANSGNHSHAAIF